MKKKNASLLSIWLYFRRDQQSNNWYSYVAGDPINNNDPSGYLAPAAAGIGIGAACTLFASAAYGAYRLGEFIADCLKDRYKRYSCLARCNCQKIDPCATCPDRVQAVGSGATEPGARKDALAKAQDAGSGLNGCYVRHCHVVRCWRN